MYGYIYKTTNLINQKIYIGQHKSQVFTRDYKGSGKLIRRAFDKYGFDNFSVELLCWCENRSDMNKLEKLYIEQYHSNDISIGYNITLGGDGGDTLSRLTESEKLQRSYKLSMSASGRVRVNNGKVMHYVKPEKLQEYLDNGYVIGDLNTPELAKIRSDAKKRFHEEHPDFRNGGMFKPGSSGFTGVHTEETKQKIRKKLVGTKQSKETRALKSKLLKQRYANGWVSPRKGKAPHNKGKTGLWFWATNGVSNIQVPTNAPIPEGYRKGRTI